MNRPPPSFFSGNSPIALVVGGAGFVGSRFCRELLGKKIRVVCVDNWQKGIKENLSEILENSNFFLLEQNPNEDLSQVIHINFSYVVDLALLEPLINGDRISTQTLQACSSGVKGLLDLSVLHSAKLLFASVLRPTLMKTPRGSGESSYEAALPRRWRGGDSSPTSEHRGVRLAADVLKTDRFNLSLMDAKHFAQGLIHEHSQRKDVDARIVLLGDVYGPGMLLGASPLSFIFKDYAYHKVIKLPTEESCVYPIYIDDAVWGMVKSLLSGGTRGRTIALAGPKSSLSEVGAIVKSLRTNVVLEHTQERETFEGLSSEQAREGRSLINWEPHTTITEGIASTLYWLDKHKDLQPKIVKSEETPSGAENKKPDGFWNMSAKTTKPKQTSSAKKRPNFFPILFLGFALLFWFFILPFVQLGMGYLNLKLVTRVSNSKPEEENWLSIADFWFSGAKDGFSRWSRPPFLKEIGARHIQESGFALGATKVLESQQAADVLTQKILVGVFGEEPFSALDVSSKLSTEEAALARKTAFLDTETYGNPKLLLQAENYFGKDSLSTLSKNSQHASELLKFLSEILGEKEKRTYLVLIQDENLARPAGGVVVGYGILTFDKARLVSSEFQPVATADNQLTGHVEPPPPLKKYSTQSNWLLKDSLWSPDFAIASRQAGWFIDKELNQTIDGVVGLDGEYLKKLHGNTEKINNENMVEVTRQLFAKISHSPEKFGKQFIQTSFWALNSKHLVLLTGSGEANNVLKDAGWSGVEGQANCLDGDCIQDYLYFSHANLGSVPDNQLTKSFTLDVALQNQSLIHRLTVLYKNAGDDNYKDYFRVMLPGEASSFSALLIKPQDDTQESMTLDIGTEGGKAEVGGYVNTPSGQERQLLLSWKTPAQGEFGEYAFVWQKQPGSKDEPFWLTISTPEGYVFKQAKPAPSLTQTSSVAYNSTLSGDFKVNVRWQKQH